MGMKKEHEEKVQLITSEQLTQLKLDGLSLKIDNISASLERLVIALTKEPEEKDGSGSK